jgi:imidazolonepropionase-like amidohydrolase
MSNPTSRRLRWLSAAALPLALGGLLLLGGGAESHAEPPEDHVESPGGRTHGVHALVGARVVSRPGLEWESATIVIRDGVIEAVGPEVPVPPDARRWDARGQTIYAGLIEPYYVLDPREASGDDAHGSDRAHGDFGGQGAGGARHTNPKVRPERAVVDELSLDRERLAELRGAGFTAALVVPGRGIFRGQSALVALRDGDPQRQVIRPRVAQHLAFEHEGWGSSDYPHSLMGAMALTRQTFLDAQHHQVAWAAYSAKPMGQARPSVSVSLDALAPVIAAELPVMLEVPDAQALLRGTSLLSELHLTPTVVMGSSDAYRWLDEVRHTGAPLIVSVNFPPPPRWETPDEGLEIETEALRRWYLAPENASRLEQAGVFFAFTAQGLKDRGDYRARVRQAIERGLSEEAALAAFTTVPAALLRAPQLGVIAPGAAANLTVTDGDLFAEDTRLLEVWIDGERHDLLPRPTPAGDVAGTWTLEFTEPVVTELPLPRLPVLQVVLKAERGLFTGAVRLLEGAAPDSEPHDLGPVEVSRGRVSCTLPATLPGMMFETRLELTVRGRLALGSYSSGPLRGEVLARRATSESGPDDSQEAEPEDVAPPVLGILSRPSWPPLPEPAPPAVLVRDALLWTLDARGVVRGDMLCVGGSIAEIASSIAPPEGCQVIEARGRHVTPGLIDCHNHSFITGGVNEGTNNCTAEVRIADVLNAETVRIYQQLAGGLTSANLLHGSANAIGGQNAVVQLRWGSPPSELLLAGAQPGIKFALGENPKRSNWGEGMPPRYPTSRMGVEESIRERFLAAREYRQELRDYGRDPTPGLIPPRRDLQLEALVEILEGRRLVHCHSYRQDEILALIRLAEELGFTIGTFQHVLEGYKVADEIAAHGAGASTFSDWWAYKFEVYDAIPYNGALMRERGVVVSFNSDSSELARRLNQEAAKAVRYGGVPPADALAFVTLNPARQLGIDRLVGSLETGKQADFVVWSEDPLSMRAICEETWIEGRRYFSGERDRAAFEVAQTERSQLLEAARLARYRDGGERAWSPTFTRQEEALEAACCDHDQEGR